MEEETYVSLPQRGGGRGKRAAVPQGHSDAHSHGVVLSHGGQIEEPIATVNSTKEMAVSVTTGLAGRYRTDAEGDACYECELRYYRPAANGS